MAGHFENPTGEVVDTAKTRSFEGLEKSLKSTYDTSNDDVIKDLYSPLLRNSVEYVRAAGFFRSSVFRLMTDDLLDFAIQGGKMTLITSLHVDRKDYDAVMEKFRNEENIGKEMFLEELMKLRENEKMVPVTEMLAALVCNGCLSIRIGLRKSGIYHRKKGYFVDENGKIVLFMGSGNETRTALESVPDEGSAEDFSVYRNWGERGAWESHGKNHYDKLLREMEEGPRHRFPIVPIQDLEPDDFLFIEGEDWLDLEIHRKYSKERKRKMRDTHDRHRLDELEGGREEPSHGAEEIVLRPHQKVGLEAWEKNGSRGILKHATASGKTITALFSIAEHMRKGLPVLVLVPSSILLNQWIEEIEKFMSPEFPDVLPVGSGHNDWRRDLALHCDGVAYDNLRRVTVAIIHSARTERFMSQIGDLKSALVVVDECHRIGAQSFSEICEWSPRKILGLSATPERYGDPAGTARMNSLCGEVVHEYSLSDALHDGYLTDYLYNIERVSLTGPETEDYDNRMDKIVRQLTLHRRKDGKVDWKSLPPGLKNAIIQAKRIIKKAERKASVCARIVSENYGETGRQENWLVYCEDGSQLDSVRAEIESLGVGPLYEYWTGAEGADIGDKVLEFAASETLRLWELTGGVMLSIQCLDEGVNIPCISHGIILASSNNPRQFIQRRGRMLRLHKGKNLARIWDALVIPSSESGGEHTNYVLNEINRASEFSKDAKAGNARIQLTNIRHDIGLTDSFSKGEIDGSTEGDEDE